MNLLLDTNALIWWLLDSARLDRSAHDEIANPGNRVYVSAVCAWEIATKIGLGKLTVPPDAASWLPAQLVANQFTPLSIAVEHALAVEQLPPHHHDPFDRLLVAQAITERMTIVSSDWQLERYPVRVMRC